MKKQDLHSHSTFDDGRDSLRRMAERAAQLGLDSLGFSGHAPLSFDNDWCIPQGRLEAYCREAEEVKAEFAGRVKIYRGIEFDLESDMSLEGFDYAIGSVHFLRRGEKLYCVDESPETSAGWLNSAFNGDSTAASDEFYARYSAIADNPQIDIVGHFDLITKFDEGGAVFPRCLLSAVAAMERLVKAGKLFEINTGAISRGYRTEPYPARELLRALRQMDGKICISSDAHSAGSLALHHDAALRLAVDCGFDRVWHLTDEGFVPIKIDL